MGPKGLSHGSSERHITKQPASGLSPSGRIKVALHKVIERPHVFFFCKQDVVCDALQNLKEKDRSQQGVVPWRKGKERWGSRSHNLSSTELHHPWLVYTEQNECDLTGCRITRIPHVTTEHAHWGVLKPSGTAPLYK